MDAIAKAKELRAEERDKEALDILFKELERRPDDPEVNYQIGWTYDASERSDQSIPYYRKALELGLEEDRDGCFLALGSSHRAIGEYESSKKVLEAAVKEFPANRALKVFLALTYYNLDQHKEAMSVLLHQLVDTSSDQTIKDYGRALEYYADNLDEVLKPTADT